jgi:hypothetical protein
MRSRTTSADCAVGPTAPGTAVRVNRPAMNATPISSTTPAVNASRAGE